jgi:microcystin-dependent protein
MPSPVTPDEVKATLPDPNSVLCGNFLGALIRLPELFYTWLSWAFDATGNGSKSLINQTLPPGSLIMAACHLNEDGSRLLCDGREVPQATYADLYAAIGATYGAASAGNFKLPDFQAKFPVGMGSFAAAGTVALGTPGGEDQHLLTAAESGLRNHTHTAVCQVSTGGQTGSSGNPVATGSGPTGTVTGGPLPATDKHNNIPPYLGVYVYVIC